ncbi:MAG: hypothetical protein H0T47_14295 [Planctomycetaceae bacterium]|nr:hypothetical protein [Planctomycetaceae bacterium]
MTQPTARMPYSAAGSDRPASADRAAALGRSSQVSVATWALVAAASTAAVIVVAPTLAGWLLLPAIPAILLRWSGRDGGSRCDHAVMRIFSIATFTAIVTQLVVTVPVLSTAIAVAAAVVLCLYSVEQLAVSRSR